MFQIQTQVIKTSEYCSENTILFVGSYNLISAVSYFSIALITVFVVIIVILIKRRRAKGKQEDGDEMKEPGEERIMRRVPLIIMQTLPIQTIIMIQLNDFILYYIYY